MPSYYSLFSPDILHNTPHTNNEKTEKDLLMHIHSPLDDVKTQLTNPTSPLSPNESPPSLLQKQSSSI